MCGRKLEQFMTLCGLELKEKAISTFLAIIFVQLEATKMFTTKSVIKEKFHT